jgi:hypothetical protein
VSLPDPVGDLSFSYSFAHRANSTPDDWFRVWVEAQDGTRTLVTEVLGTPHDVDARWSAVRVPLTPWAGQTVRIVIGAADGGNDTRVEAAVDDLRIEQP